MRPQPRSVAVALIRTRQHVIWGSIDYSLRICRSQPPAASTCTPACTTRSRSAPRGKLTIAANVLRFQRSPPSATLSSWIDAVLATACNVAILPSCLTGRGLLDVPEQRRRTESRPSHVGLHQRGVKAQLQPLPTSRSCPCWQGAVVRRRAVKSHQDHEVILIPISVGAQPRSVGMATVIEDRHSRTSFRRQGTHKELT